MQERPLGSIRLMSPRPPFILTEVLLRSRVKDNLTVKLYTPSKATFKKLSTAQSVNVSTVYMFVIRIRLVYCLDHCYGNKNLSESP